MNRKSGFPVLFLGLAVATWTGFAYAGEGMSGHDHGGMMQQRQGATMEHHDAEGTAHSHEACELHGGQVAMTKAHHFETVFDPKGMSVYMYSGAQTPMMMEKITGTAALKFVDGSTKEIPLTVQSPVKGEDAVYFCPMHTSVVQKEPGVCKACGGMELMKQNYLRGAVDLSKVEAGSMKAMIHVKGMTGDEPDAAFMETFQMMHGDDKAAQGHPENTGMSGHDH